MQTMQQVNEASADPYKVMKIIQRCSHCGEETGKGNKFCKNCTLVANRREMCEENKKIMPNYQCKMCGI